MREQGEFERPESYKQWQVQNQRAGFRQLPLNRDIIKEVCAKVKAHYHKDFVVEAYSSVKVITKILLLFLFACFCLTFAINNAVFTLVTHSSDEGDMGFLSVVRLGERPQPLKNFVGGFSFIRYKL